MKILIIGPDGQIGWELLNSFRSPVQVIGAGRAQMDLSVPHAIRATIRDVKPDLIINAGAYTAVDKAESEHELADVINNTAVGVIGEEAKRLGAAVIHYSTDYIFDGSGKSPYLPTDAPNPQSVYGRSKLHGEQSLLASGAKSIILRTEWVYGMRGRNFLLTMLRLAEEKDELRIVNDQIGAPTWSRSIAQATAKIVAHSFAGKPGDCCFSGREGVYHLTSSGSTSWFDFARTIFQLADLARSPKLIPISSAEYAAPAARPAYSVLDCSSTKKTFDVQIDAWDNVLREVLKTQPQ